MASMLTPEDKLSIEFFTLTMKKKRPKLVAIYDIILESLIHSKYIDLPEESLSNPNNYLIASTVQLKLYYTPPDIEKQKLALGLGNPDEVVDWSEVFDDGGRHGGHRSRHIYSKKDGKL